MYSILIVDDEPLALRGMKAGIPFQELGFTSVYTAMNSAEAKLYFQKKHIDLLLCDIEMPGDSGLILAQWVNDFYPGTVILFLTAHANFSYAQDAVRLMAFRYLLKPVSYSELTQILSDALKRLPSVQHIDSTGDLKSAAATDTNSVVKQTIAYIHDHLQEPISRESLGKNVYLNPNYLARLFKEKTGVSLVTYITNLRLETACHLLKNTTLSIAEICEQVGFHDHSYFTKIFKRQYNVSPRQYRETSI